MAFGAVGLCQRLSALLAKGRLVVEFGELLEHRCH